MKKLIVITSLLFTAPAFAVPAPPSFNVSGVGRVDGTSFTNAVNPAGLSTVSDGNGGFLTNAINQIAGTTDISTHVVDGVATWNVANNTEGVSYGFNGGGENIKSKLKLESSFNADGIDFGQSVAGMAAGRINGTGVTQAFVTGSTSDIFSGGSLVQTADVRSFGLAQASGTGNVSAIAVSRIHVNQFQ